MQNPAGESTSQGIRLTLQDDEGGPKLEVNGNVPNTCPYLMYQRGLTNSICNTKHQ